MFLISSVLYEKFLSKIRLYQFNWIRNDSVGRGESMIADAHYGSWNSVNLIKIFISNYANRKSEFCWISDTGYIGGGSMGIYQSKYCTTSADFN